MAVGKRRDSGAQVGKSGSEGSCEQAQHAKATHPKTFHIFNHPKKKAPVTSTRATFSTVCLVFFIAHFGLFAVHGMLQVIAEIAVNVHAIEISSVHI